MARLPRVESFDPPAETPPPSGVAWSAPLGVLGDFPIRAHVSLAVVLTLAVGACLRGGAAIGWLLLSVYGVSLFLHEAAHALAGARQRRRSYDTRPIVLGPAGGLSSVGLDDDVEPLEAPEHDPRERVFVAMAGPLASLTVVVVATCCLATADGSSAAVLLRALLSDPVAALAAESPLGATPLATLAACFVAVNWPLFLVNLCPASPFDGGTAVRAWLEIAVGRRHARDAALLVALVFAAGLLGAAAALVIAGEDQPLTAAALGALAVVVAFGARADAVRRPRGPLAWRSLEPDDDLGAPLPRLGRGDLVAAELRPFDQSAGEAPEDRADERGDDDRVDDILAKVHVNGLRGLTDQERAILERASRRYQRRRRAD